MLVVLGKFSLLGISWFITLMFTSSFKYHVLYTDGKFSVRINLLFYLNFPPSFHLTVVCFCPVGRSLLLQHFQQVLWVLKLLLSPGLGS
jgi:hypothetical protein